MGARRCQLPSLLVAKDPLPFHAGDTVVAQNKKRELPAAIVKGRGHPELLLTLVHVWDLSPAQGWQGAARMWGTAPHDGIAMVSSTVEKMLLPNVRTGFLGWPGEEGGAVTQKAA